MRSDVIYKDSYAKWLDKVLRDEVKRHRNAYESCEAYLRDNAFLVTFTFDHRKITEKREAASKAGQPASQMELSEVAKLYNKVCRSLLGPNYSRRRDDQPMMIAALDAEGTRYGYRIERPKNLHVHSIWILPRGQANRFEEAIQRISGSPNMEGLAFDQIDVRKIVSYRTKPGEPSDVCSYLAKFQGMNTERCWVAEDLQIFPRTRSDQVRPRAPSMVYSQRLQLEAALESAL